MQLDNRSFLSPYSTSSALTIAKQAWLTAFADGWVSDVREQVLLRHQLVRFPTDFAYAH